MLFLTDYKLPGGIVDTRVIHLPKKPKDPEGLELLVRDFRPSMDGVTRVISLLDREQRTFDPSKEHIMLSKHRLAVEGEYEKHEWWGELRWFKAGTTLVVSR